MTILFFIAYLVSIPICYFLRKVEFHKDRHLKNGHRPRLTKWTHGDMLSAFVISVCPLINWVSILCSLTTIFNVGDNVSVWIVTGKQK